MLRSRNWRWLVNFHNFITKVFSLFSFTFASLGVQLISSSNKVGLKVFGKKLSTESLIVLGAAESSAEGEHTSGEIDQDGKIEGISGSSSNYNVFRHNTVKFGISNEISDAGQSFVPFFDGSDVAFNNKAPLRGVGFLLFEQAGTAGYIRPYLLTYNYNNLIDGSG